MHNLLGVQSKILNGARFQDTPAPPGQGCRIASPSRVLAELMNMETSPFFVV